MWLKRISVGVKYSPVIHIHNSIFTFFEDVSEFEFVEMLLIFVCRGFEKKP